MTFFSTRSCSIDLLSSRHDDALLLAYREADQPPFGDEEMKVKVRRGRVVDMSKTMDPAEADGENLGIVKFGAGGAPPLVEHHGPARRRRRLRDWAPRAFREFAQDAAAASRSARAGFPGSRSTFPRTIDARSATCCRRSRPTRRRLVASGRRTSAPAGTVDGRRAMRPAVSATLHFNDRWPRRRRKRAAHRLLRAIVAIGGGTGLPNVLRGLRPMLFARSERDASRAIASSPIVATSDDGGSSGRLRAEFNIIPPGDIRNCLAALSDNQSQIADLFQYRFGAGDGLNGHASATWC